MKRTLLLLAILPFALSACYVELDIDDQANVYIDNVYEYEDRRLINSVYRNGQLVYEEYENKAMLDITLRNSGLEKARNVTLEIAILDGGWMISQSSVHVGDIYPRERASIEFDTGMAFINDYTDYTIDLRWN